MAQVKNSKEELAKKIWGDWENGLAYQKKINLKETCEQCVDFVEGRQWAPVTERTKTLPRPVCNILEYIVNGKKSNILSSKISVVYKPLIYSEVEGKKATEGATAFTNFAHHIRKEIKQEDLDNLAILDGLIKGTYIFHYFWDREKKTGMAKYNGGLNGQIIDPLNIVFANPKQKSRSWKRPKLFRKRVNQQWLQKP